MLYFGTSLPHSLLNLNQLRLGGTPVRDNPTQKEFGLELPDGNWIPHLTASTKISCDSRVPTQTELQDCQRVYLNYDDEWNPARQRRLGFYDLERKMARRISRIC